MKKSGQGQLISHPGDSRVDLDTRQIIWTPVEISVTASVRVSLILGCILHNARDERMAAGVFLF